jgi:hypothetical protein
LAIYFILKSQLIGIEHRTAHIDNQFLSYMIIIFILWAKNVTGNTSTLCSSDYHKFNWNWITFGSNITSFRNMYTNKKYIFSYFILINKSFEHFYFNRHLKRKNSIQNKGKLFLYPWGSHRGDYLFIYFDLISEIINVHLGLFRCLIYTFTDISAPTARHQDLKFYPCQSGITLVSVQLLLSFP